MAILAGLMVMLPLGEVLRYQTDEAQALMAERALLDPLAHAVSLQRSLISHGEVAQHVLGGRRQLEGERMLRQYEVDEAVLQLKTTLSAGLWDRALAETDDLALDWRELSGRIYMRRVDASTSHAGHRLLVEQAVQVMDLLSTGAGPQGRLARLAAIATRQSAALALQSLPFASAAGIATLDLAHSALMLRSAQLHEQQGSLQAARNQLLASLSLLALTLLAALAWSWRRGRSPAPPPEPPGKSERRGHGRRNTDQASRGDAVEELIQQLRQADATPNSVDQPVLPPKH